MQELVYIDESGDLGERGSEYLVLSALIVKNSKPLERIIKNMRRYKFRKELSKAQEIKANKSSGEIKKYMLEKLGEIQGAKVMFVVLEKKKLFSQYLKNDKNKLYNYVAGKLAKNLEIGTLGARIWIDKSKGRQLLQDDFNSYFRQNLKNHEAKIEISHSYSHCWAGLQFADVLAWACFQKFERRDSTFVDLIKIDKDVNHVW